MTRPSRLRISILAVLAAIATASVAGPVADAAQAPVTVRVRPGSVYVGTPGASATIERDPVRISFANAAGRTVLRGMAGNETASQAVPPVPRPQFGSQGTPPPTLYAPLNFLVGQLSIDQFPASQWTGNLQTVTEGGTEYGAVAVERVRIHRSGVSLVMSTSDPSGRKLNVRVGAEPGSGTIVVDARPSPKSGVVTMGDSFSSPQGEAFRGFGGRHDSIDQAGNEFYNWMQQENLSAGGIGGPAPPDAPDPELYLFPNGESAAYYVQSSFISPDRYGFLLDRDELSEWRLASDRDNAWQVQAASRKLRYIVAPGTSHTAIRNLTAITGRHRVPPAWAIGPTLDRLVRFPDESAADYGREVRSDLRNLRRHRIDLSAYRIEGWQFLPRSFLKHVIDVLRDRGIKPILYLRSFVGEDGIGTDDPRAYDVALKKGYVATRADGTPYTFTSNFNAPGAQIDFTDPKAVKWWRSRVEAALKLGAEGFMEDFGEQVQVGMHFHNGATGWSMHNRLAVLFHRATWGAVRKFERAHPGRRIFYYDRAGYSGTPGSARYEFANFPGDETTDWSRSAGIASLAPDMLNRGIGGAYGFTTDIGGFFDIPYGATSKELFIRWAEWAALSPMFRVHGSVAAGTHTPWSYGAETLRIYKRMSALHRRAEPLIMRLWKRANRTGMPIASPLWLNYPHDGNAARQDQEWMLGRNVLVAPVIEKGAVTRTAYFPRGCWRTAEGERFVGPRSAYVRARLGRLPYFIRCGTHPLR
jgi:alpha-glucosidase (family GH31 glycosyl hydrolase)